MGQTPTLWLPKGGGHCRADGDHIPGGLAASLLWKMTLRTATVTPAGCEEGQLAHLPCTSPDCNEGVVKVTTTPEDRRWWRPKAPPGPCPTVAPHWDWTLPPGRGDGGFLEAPTSSSEQKSQNNILDT